MWYEERFMGKKIPKFRSCCANGKVKLPEQPPMEPTIRDLLSDKLFMDNIRGYNASFAFCSFSAKTDENIKPNGIYTYKVQGIIHHRVGPLSSNLEKKQNAQIYITDGEMQDQLRMNYNNKLDILTLKKLRFMLYFECKNPYIQQFHAVEKMLKSNPLLDLKIAIVTDKNNDKRRYNEPTVKEIAIIIPESDEPIKRCGIIFEKNGSLQSIDVNLAAYDPLQYPLLFPTGQRGWEYNMIKLQLEQSDKSKY
jgi:hypothetical protein